MKELETDVAIVGTGPAGLAAAISAAEDGRSVIALEKAMKSGGAANMGMGPLGIDTNVQKEELSSITVEKAFDMFMNYTHWRVDANLVKKYFEKSADTISWLQDMGVEFYKASKYFPASEATWHIVQPESGQPGPRAAGTMIKRMTEYAENLGVKILYETSGEELLMDDSRISGIIAKKNDETAVKIKCKTAVIATGGFGDNVEKLKETTGYEYNEDYFGFRVPGVKGDGIRMAREVGGGKTDINIEMATTLPGEHITPAIAAAFNQPNLLVNLNGERFFNEELFENTTFAGNAINIQKERCGIMIIDESIKRHYLKCGVDVMSMVLHQKNIDGFDTQIKNAIKEGNPYLFKADTLDELAEMAGIDKDQFKRTVKTYNYYCKTSDKQFNKRSDYLRPLVKAPYYAAKFFPGAYGTLGGIKVNHYTEVITNDYKVIPGLYAAGTDTCTIYGDSYMFLLPGNTMGYALNTGRMAGENAADYIKFKY